MDSTAWLFPIVLFFIEIIGTVGAFGSSLLLVPIAGLFFPFRQVLLLTACLHVVSNLSKIFLFREGLNRFLLWNMGLPSIISVVAGAFLSVYVNDLWAGILLGIFLIVFSVWMLRNPEWKLESGRVNAIAGGAIAGFTAGLLGTGGAIRGVSLAAFDLSKQVFVATSAAIDFGVDFSRLFIYQSQASVPEGFWTLFPLMLLASYTGTWTGKRILERVSQERFRALVLWLILLTGIGSISGAIYRMSAG